jgi:lipopolysaccharide/colanic/teichoic acid biosynthesis glycosyltransferase
MRFNGAPLKLRLIVSELDVVSPWCNSLWKRGWDLFWAALLLLLLSPVMLVMALAIKLSSRGPVFFRQGRLGKGGHEFSILKFRTMVADAHEVGPVLT